MAMQAAKRANIRLPPEVNRILYVRNLPYKITAEEMYDIFGKYGPIRQIRTGNTPETRGTAYVVYEDIFDAKNACFPEDGHKEERGTVEASKREIWYQHRPSKVAVWRMPAPHHPHSLPQNLFFLLFSLYKLHV
ncbi:hypothetical protein INR49_004406 [Caranx melampygus]|nr:hypothetical protein INR49_004406 [Caranx melampygus]